LFAITVRVEGIHLLSQVDWTFRWDVRGGADHFNDSACGLVDLIVNGVIHSPAVRPSVLETMNPEDTMFYLGLF
jgi:hypothetical protein